MKNRMFAQEYLAMNNAPDPRRQIRGAQSRAAGIAFEGLVRASCEMYKNRRTAFIEKTPEPMKILGVIDRLRGIFKCCHEKPAQPDFKGTLAGGRSVCFEAKHTECDRIEQDCVTEQQKDALDLHHALGAHCFVLVSLGMQNFYRVPWLEWRSMKEKFGHKYMSAAELEPRHVPVLGGMILFLSGGGAP